jgi:hypothetical protein
LSDDERCTGIDFGFKILYIRCEIRGFRMAFGVTRDSDVEIVSVALTNVLNKIDGVGEEWTPRFLWRFLPGLVPSQGEDILATGSMSVLGTSVRP